MKEKNLRWRICSLALATSIALNTLTVQAEVKDKPVARLEVTSQPQRTVYDVGEDVDLYGMKVKVIFTDGEIYVANANDLTYQGYQPNVVGSQLILAMYGEYSVPITVTVKQGELRSISVKLNKTGVWIAGTTLTPDMFKVTAHTDSGSTRDVEDFTITPTVLTEGRNNITIDYHGETATAVIDAKKNSVQTIRIESPGKQEFDYGEGFSTQGLEVIAHLLDGSERDVTADCTVTGVNTGKLGEQYAKVEYEEKLVTYKVNVVQYIFDHIDITRWKDENVVEVYYKDREEPVVVTAQNVYIVDQDSTGTRTFQVHVGNNVYTVESEIPKEERVYRNTKMINVSVPIGLATEVDVEGRLGYIPETPLEANGVRISIEEVDKCESLEGLPATISNGKLTLHLERDYAEPKYYRWKAKLEVE